MDKQTKIIILIGLTLSIIAFLLPVNSIPDLPEFEEHNSMVAFQWHYEQFGGSEMPACSCQAMDWIDQYREAHNLTSDNFRCAVYYNDMTSWHYY